MGSPSDMEYALEVSEVVKSFDIPVFKRIASAHKTTDAVLQIVAQYEGMLFYWKLSIPFILLHN